MFSGSGWCSLGFSSVLVAFPSFLSFDDAFGRVVFRGGYVLIVWLGFVCAWSWG